MTVAAYILYDRTTGRAMQIGTLQDEEECEQQRHFAEDGFVALDEMLINPADVRLLYVAPSLDTSTVQSLSALQRPTFPAIFNKTTIRADDTDEARLSDIPEGAVLTIDGEEHIITGGLLTLTSPMPAIYRFAFTGWPYQDWEATLEAVA